MALEFRIADKPAATTSTVNHAMAALWNPSTTVQLRVDVIEICTTTAVAIEVAVRRISARGTPGSSVTSTINNAHGQEVAPPSGAILDKAAYSVQPTAIANDLCRFQLPAAIGSAMIWQFREPIEINPGQGLALVSVVAALAAPVVSFGWDE